MEATCDTPAPFSKIVLSKLLILPNAKAREDYFKQQSTFVTKEGSDDYTEFSTSIQGKMCAVIASGKPVYVINCPRLTRHHRLCYKMYCSKGLSATDASGTTSRRCSFCKVISTSLVLALYVSWHDCSVSHMVCPTLRRVASDCGKGDSNRKDGIIVLELV